MTCDPLKGCPLDTHNLHCGYPDCAKGKREREARMTPTETLVAELETAERILHAKPCEVYGLEQTCAEARTTLTTQAARIEELTRELDKARAECEEQARLNGMGAEREAALIARAEAAEAALADARNKALEEAATIASDYTVRKRHNFNHTGAAIAADIRKIAGR